MNCHFRSCGRIGYFKMFLAVLFIACLPVPRLAAQEVNSLTGKPVVARNADGQLELFEIDAAGELRQRWQKKSNGDWSSWSCLGGSFFPGIAVANAADGCLRIFAVDRATHALKCLCQCATNQTEWSAWQDLGGSVLPPVAVAPDADGCLEVFAVSTTTGSARHIRQTGPDAGWSSWTDLGGVLRGGLVAARNNDGRIDLFGIQAQGQALAHCWQHQPNTSNDWSGWANLGGAIQPGFAVGQNLAGILEIFAVNTNAEVLRKIQTIPGNRERWTPWEDFRQEQGPNQSSSTRDFDAQWRGLADRLDPGLVVGKGGDGRLEVFALDLASGYLVHRWELLVTGADRWSRWCSMGLTTRPNPAVGANEDGDLEVFTVDPKDADLIHHRRQISSSSDWLDWSSLNHRTFQYQSRTWQSDEGLPDNLVQALAQTADGFLWVGTRAGLARFDGSQFFSYDARNTPALKNSSITALCADYDGGLWIGTDGGGVLRLKGGVFSQFSRTNGLAGDAVRVIYKSRDGSIWIGTTTGMSRWQDGQLKTSIQPDALLSQVVRSIYEDRDGNLWVATGKGLNQLPRQGTNESFVMPNGLPNDAVRVIWQDRGGRIWIGSNNGLLWYNWFYGYAFYAYNTKYGLSDTFVSAICEDTDDNLWVGTYSGLNRFHEGRFYSQPDNNGQAFGKVNALLVDREGDLWVGSQEGLSRLTPEKFFTYTKQQGLSHNNVMSVLQDHQGNLWVGTWGGGLDELQSDKFLAYLPTNGLAAPATNDLSRDLILSLCEGRDGSLWVGADFDGGLTQIKNGTVRHYTVRDGLLDAGLHVLHEDAQGMLWIGTDRGLSCLVDGKFITNAATIALAGTSVRDICNDRSGALWLATPRGLGRWQDGKFTALPPLPGLPDEALTALYVDPENTLWIGTASGGLIRHRNGEFTAYGAAQGLFSDEILGIIQDDQGWLWMTCSKGIFRVHKKDFDDLDRGQIQSVTSLVYGKNDGMRSPQCNGNGKPSVWKSWDGQLWFPTSKGLVTVDPNAVSIDGKPPTVFVETVVADARTIEDGRTNLAGATYVLASRSALQIPPGHGQLEFQYAALGFSEPEKERFKYRLEGVDAAWIDAGMRRVAYYNNLAPGSYRFEVRAANRDGLWNDTGAALAVVLRPHYWQTLWFRGTLAGGVSGLVLGLTLYAGRRRMQRKLVILEQQQAVEKERGRIAKDMHDQMGAGLTQIGLLGEFVRRDADKNGDSKGHAVKISGLARELAQTLDEIVWTVNPRNDTLNKLGAYLAAYAEEFFRGTPVRCRLDIPPGLPALPVSAELRHNLFLTVKEALNNVVKHSRATEASLRLALEADRLELVIQDDGAGFDPGIAKFSRNGLSNMRERIAEIGGQLEIFSQPQKGTRISLQVPLNLVSR